MTAESKVIAVKADDVAEVLRWCTLGPDRVPHQNMNRHVNICNAAGRVLNEWKKRAPDLWIEVISKLAERVLDGRIDPNESDDHPPIGTRSEVMPACEIQVRRESFVQWEKDHWIAFIAGNQQILGEGKTKDEALRDLERKLNK